MAEAARRHTDQGPARFSYRLVSPLYARQGCVVTAEPDGAELQTAVRDDTGRTTATGTFGEG